MNLQLTPEHFPEYELIDCGDYLKLERFGRFITIRPEPQALWHRRFEEAEWERLAHVEFIQKTSSAGSWRKIRQMPDQWKITYTPAGGNTVCLRLGLTSFKHVGVFPEQAVNWEYIYRNIKRSGINGFKMLNLFAYTGGASLVARSAGAEVTHVDSIRQVISWANENQHLSNLDDIRWVVEDALKFVKREVRRGNHYHGIIMDPPAYGHGPAGEKWKLEDQLSEILEDVYRLLFPEKHFLILNAYSLGLSPLIIENLLLPGAVNTPETGELYLNATSGVKLPLGVFGRFSTFQG